MLLNIEDEITSLVESAKDSILSTTTLPALEQLRVHYLGKKGQFTEVLKNLNQVSAEDRPKFGKVINIAKQQLLELFNDKKFIYKNMHFKRNFQQNPSILLYRAAAI